MTARAVLRKNRFVNAIKKSAREGTELTDLFAVKAKSLAMSSRDKPYLRVTLEDRSGTIDAFVWDDAAEYNGQIREGDIVGVRGRSHVHKDVPQLRVERIWPLTEKDLEEIDLAEFRPGLDQPTRERIWKDVLLLLAAIENPFLRALLDGLTSDPDLRDAFLEGTAAKSIHHAYLGGLAEHTLGVLRLAMAVAGLYPAQINRDLLIAGAFLHDLAKIEEFDSRSGGYTDAGRLVGHLSLGVRMIEKRADAIPGFPRALLLHLEHMILSHHSRPDWGSPVKAQTLEAIALHFIDNLDAKVAGGWAWMEAEEVPGGGWSSFWRGQDSQILRTPRLDGLAPDGASPRGFADVEVELLRQADEPDPGRRVRESDDAETPHASPRKPPRRPPPGQERLF